MALGLRMRRLSLIFLAMLPAAAAAQPTGDGFFSSAGVRIRYIDRGLGEPVVLLHGYTGNIEQHLVQPVSSRTYNRIIA